MLIDDTNHNDTIWLQLIWQKMVALVLLLLECCFLYREHILPYLRLLFFIEL